MKKAQRERGIGKDKATDYGHIPQHFIKLRSEKLSNTFIVRRLLELRRYRKWPYIISLEQFSDDHEILPH